MSNRIPPPQCIAITARNTRCKGKPVTEGAEFCKRHKHDPNFKPATEIRCTA